MHLTVRICGRDASVFTANGCLTAGSLLGVMPPGEEVASLCLPLIGTEQVTSSEAMDHTSIGSDTANADKPGDVTPFTLGEGLPPVPAKLVAKILKGDFLDMAELLRDNMEAERRWCLTFLTKWNGVSQEHPEAVITSDASGNWGCGAFSSQSCWFQLQWPQQWAKVHITVKELQPIVVACAVWGKNWRGQTIKCICDNAAVVAIINSGRSKDKLAMHILRCLFFFTAHFNLSLFAQHLPGIEKMLLLMLCPGIIFRCFFSRYLRPNKIPLYFHRNSCRHSFFISPTGHR